MRLSSVKVLMRLSSVQVSLQVREPKRFALHCTAHRGCYLLSDRFAFIGGYRKMREESEI